jgi:hypothetical protein
MITICKPLCSGETSFRLVQEEGGDPKTVHIVETELTCGRTEGGVGVEWGNLEMRVFSLPSYPWPHTS